MYPLSIHLSYRREQAFLVRYLIPLLVVGAWTVLIKWVYPRIDLVNLEMTYLGINVIIALRYGQGPAIAACILSVVSFDYFFVPPYFAMTVKDTKYWLTFAIMIAVTMLISRLTLQSKQSAEEALAAELKAEREKLINSLLSSVSHDLRTPLTSISGAASTLREQGAKVSLEDRQRLLEMINDESVHLNRLVEKILQITKLESGNIQVRKEGHSLEEVLGSVLHRLDRFLEGRKITTEIPGELSASFDALLIEQVFVNLLENALRYTPAGSPIDIRAFQDSKQVWVEIMDRGPGVPVKDQNRIFEKFYRSDKEHVWGSGLGLAICQAILKIHQGKIAVKDREGGGSIFYFTLPLM
jgi:two-component system, OmpR family, sensor histidine kinase KdpD